MPVERPAIVLPSVRLVRALVVAVVAVVVAGVVLEEMHYGPRQVYLFGFGPRFFLNEEQSIPNFLSILLYLVSAFLLALIAAARKREADPWARHWKWLAVIFFLLALDDQACIHEAAIKPLRVLLHAGNLFYFAWVIPAVAFLFFFALAYLRFLFHLPPRTRALFVAAAAVLVTGAVGMEMVGGLYASSRGGEDSQAFQRLASVEETLEMAGVVLFVHALLGYIRTALNGVRLSVGEAV